MKEFTEQDLKVGMLVKTSQYDNFGYGMVVDGTMFFLTTLRKCGDIVATYIKHYVLTPITENFSISRTK